MKSNGVLMKDILGLNIYPKHFGCMMDSMKNNVGPGVLEEKGKRVNRDWSNISVQVDAKR